MIATAALPVRARRAATATPNGVVLYRGPSRIDGGPIAVVANGLTTPSRNEKTGAMIQTWIMRSDVSPLEAKQGDLDVSVCGDCSLRGRLCYVRVSYAPMSIFHALERDAYPALDLKQHGRLIVGKQARIGSYGDPAACPASVWAPLLSTVSMTSGYTHQWRKPWAQHLRAICMASVESEDQALEAWARGWRTFRVMAPGETRLLRTGRRREMVCGASEAGGKRTHCDRCGLCCGMRLPMAPSVAIPAHGGLFTMRAWAKR